MNTDHPDEEVIQQCAIGRLMDNNILKHIHNCEHCRQKMVTYQFIVKEIEQDDKPAFEFDLASEMVMRIAEEVAPEKTYWKDSVLIIIAFTFLGGSVYVFRDSILAVFSGTSATLFYAICTTAISILIWQIISLSNNHQRQMKALDLVGTLQH